MSGYTVRALRPFLPAKDFAQSKRFYADLGFSIRPLDEGLAEVSLGASAFLLQDYFVEEWASNAMTHMLVEDLGAWWARIDAADLAARYRVEPPRAPKRESWGLDVAYVFDPAGVLWHVAAEP